MAMPKFLAFMILAFIAISMVQTTVIASNGNGGHHNNKKEYGPRSVKSYQNVFRDDRKKSTNYNELRKIMATLRSGSNILNLKVELRFSLAEFAVITGLLCTGDNNMKKYAKREHAFVDKYFFEHQNDDDLVLTNEKELVVEVEKVEDEMFVENKCNVENVLDETIVENKFSFVVYLLYLNISNNLPANDNGNDDKKELVDDDHEMFKNGSNKLREDDNDGDDKVLNNEKMVTNQYHQIIFLYTNRYKRVTDY
ncbi:hypothetical protein F8388_018403 [Cannabis sativa]|uniref:Uncharacterized protein n=1 Tax=Cannabis sativa TaxID=3483 RepID=A0A7J6E7K3_CANSA|nr:hypothetical protein F8388_018403 [Cannabis sativa]